MSRAALAATRSQSISASNGAAAGNVQHGIEAFRAGVGDTVCDIGVERDYDVGEERRIGEGRRDVVAQRPCARQQIHVRVTIEVEVGEVRDRISSAIRSNLAGPDETPEGLSHLEIEQVGRMDILGVAKQPRLDARAERRLQEEFQHCRTVDDGHADSRSARMTAAAVVFNVRRVRP